MFDLCNFSRQVESILHRFSSLWNYSLFCIMYFSTNIVELVINPCISIFMTFEALKTTVLHLNGSSTRRNNTACYLNIRYSIFFPAFDTSAPLYFGCGIFSLFTIFWTYFFKILALLSWNVYQCILFLSNKSSTKLSVEDMLDKIFSS